MPKFHQGILILIKKIPGKNQGITFHFQYGNPVDDLIIYYFSRRGLLETKLLKNRSNNNILRSGNTPRKTFTNL